VSTARERVRRAASDIERATARRDAAIAEMRDEGASLRDIASAAGLTHPGVAKILTRLDARST
jgi:lambda repressor-like predicted transcriptional regulator